MPAVLGQAVAAITLLLLGASGVAKLLDPDPTSGALRAARLPSSRGLSRLLGMVEVAAAALGLSVGAGGLIPAAALYAGFAVFTLAALRNWIPLQSCGCFGRDDTPPSVIHVVYNLVATISLVWLMVTGAAAFPWTAPPLEMILFAVFAGIGAYASYLLLARLPTTLRLARTS